MLPSPKNIPQSAIDRGKRIVHEAPQYDMNWVDEQVALMMKEEFGLIIFSPKQLPVEPPGFSAYMSLSAEKRAEQTDPNSMQCKAYLYHRDIVKTENETMARTLKNQLIPAFDRLNMDGEATICRGLLSEHEETGVQQMSFDEAERRYGI